jgi:hypothetical protein
LDEALQMAARVALAQRDTRSLARWTEAYRSIRGAPMSLSPQLRGLYNDHHPRIAIQKAAQVGVSEYLINTAFWAADIAWGGRGNVIYYLPTLVMADDFSQARIDKAIESSWYLSERIGSRRGRRGADRVNLHRVGDGHFYVRGTEHDRHMTSIDADVVILDELDRMRLGVYERSQARLGSAELPLLRVASTPMHPNLGINLLFQLGDQRRWFTKCPRCGLEQFRTWQENVDLERELVVCRACQCELPMDTDGRWIATKPEQEEIHSYHFSKLDSRFFDVAAAIEANRSSDPLRIDEFYNNDLGEPHVSEGAGLSVPDLDECRGQFTTRGEGEITLMGVDVGMVLHVVIRTFVKGTGESRLEFAQTVRTFEELPELMTRFGVRWCVIDSQPELHMVSKFISTRPTRILAADYNRTERGHVREKRAIHLNRTQLLDALFESFRQGAHRLPENARGLGGAVRDGIGEYYHEMLALQRLVERNSRGDLTARYENAHRADHFAHAEAYCYSMFIVRYGSNRGRGVAS